MAPKICGSSSEDLLEELGGSGDDLLVGHVAQNLIDAPSVAEGMGDLPVAIAPEGIFEGLEDPGGES